MPSHGIGTRTLSLADATVPTPDPEPAKQYARFVAATHGVHLAADDAKKQHLRFVCSMHNMTGARR